MQLQDLYSTKKHQADFSELLHFAASHQQYGMPAYFLEKDLWVTELLRLLFSEKLVGDLQVAFKGGTALSKCWRAIDRFSEDVDLSIHWANLADVETANEESVWNQTTKNRSQCDKFRDKQSERLTEWSKKLVEKLNNRFEQYNIDGIKAELDAESHGEKIIVSYPKVVSFENKGLLDYILLEFGARNRGRPTVPVKVSTYLNEIDELGESTLELPNVEVPALRQDYILWEKLTALHQLSTQTKEPKYKRLSRHWYDVACLLDRGFADPISTRDAMSDVVTMKHGRWPEPGVDYLSILTGGLILIPVEARQQMLRKEYEDSKSGRLFFSEPKSFDAIILQLQAIQDSINQSLK